ncbi:regulatory protein, luxR family [[Clostridium] propionicum DSM 1682]|uniref:HTH-type transcriptional regulator MalT n=2 Tax=Anaerotignum propionicum TaxID=28446 RepID=A0A0X1U7Y7_ANAPI|nr:helix-turn-helix transcriptional regulator [Anaerotignum propionicum]AMJ41056.1 HTH-type transcriptional regulator MalT [Anaerotignum propionicum DSM 1682]MEA5056160.1 helix-turn-helix transcriptional regulator [Anaerotignum propionicum]SHE62407.1 regulatory protein, luxR family [[Clostridium] propionicum DSM 1682] [Anaerotignum propionicum DSM 1682]
MILNSIVYKIHTNTDFLAMRKELLEQLKMIIDFDSADFHLSKGDGSISLISRVSYNNSGSVDFSRVYEGIDYSQGILGTGKSMVYRETDIISDEKRVETEYYKNVYQVNNWHFSLQLILGYNERFLGVITFYRHKEKEDFKYVDVFKMQLIKDHLAYRIYKEQESATKYGDKISIQDAVELFCLTKRESGILELMMSGYSNEEICDKSSISNNTLKKHVLNIYRKLGIKNRVQLFRMIIET